MRDSDDRARPGTPATAPSDDRSLRAALGRRQTRLSRTSYASSTEAVAEPRTSCAGPRARPFRARTRPAGRTRNALIACLGLLARTRGAPRTVPRLRSSSLFSRGQPCSPGSPTSGREIAAVMGGAWLIVAFAEWAGSRGDRMRAQIFLSPIGVPQQLRRSPKADPTWFTPPVEHTLLAGRRPVDGDHDAAAGRRPGDRDHRPASPG